MKHDCLRLRLLFRWMLFLIVLFIPVFLSSQTVRINEFMARNTSTLADEDGDYSDWIEIYNSSSAAVDLKDWALTDDKGNPGKWKFPQVVLDANAYLVIFASGKDRTVAGQELHTNFNIDGDGEYLALIDPNGTIATKFDPAFPEQQRDVSFSYFDGDYIASSTPTPGAENQFTDIHDLPAPVFSQKHGFYESPFYVTIMTNLSSAQVYYTTDGSIPDETHGSLYAEPILIQTTTVLRAVTFKSGGLKSATTTCTYLFLNDVIHQSNNPDGYPSTWGPYTAISGTARADYEMDPEITTDSQYAPQMKGSLLALPTLSIVTDKDNLFSKSTNPETGGIYIYTGPPEAGDAPGLGDGWERPVSAELFDQDGHEDFQVDCGLRIHGGHSRRPEKAPKHSFRLAFRSEYGAANLNYPLFGDDATDVFNTVVLRACYGNTWIHMNQSERLHAQYIRDVWAKDAQLAMEHPSGHNRYVHLYINGIYWGIYNPTERIDQEFAATYLGGTDTDYDVIKDYTSVVDGNIDAWNKMMQLARQDMSLPENYQRIQGNNPDGTQNPNYEAYLDVENFIDYMILNFYGANWDWDHHNWIAVRNRVNPGKGFKFFSWDAEHVDEVVSDNILDEYNSGCPSEVFQSLRKNAEFRRLFADRVQLLCYNGGVLTPETAKKLWMKRADEIELAVISESARWGDYRRDVHPWTVGPYELYTQQYWFDEQSFMINQYFPNRTATFVNQLQQANLFPSVSTPTFRINGSPVTQNAIHSGDMLSMTAPAQTAIYFTTDGSDPAAITETNQEVLVPETADKRAFVPKSDIGDSWRTDLNFDDSGWSLVGGSPGGIGYERSSGYEDLISLDVENEMYSGNTNPNTSCYVRISFNLSDSILDSLTRLSLEVLYDDGFVAYMNGIQVANVNAPSNEAWNSMSTSGHEATDFVSFDISQILPNLVEGQNLLAIQGLNANLTSSDFLINARLLGSTQKAGGNVSSGALVYANPIELTQSTRVKARAWDGSEWSALNEMLFVIQSDLQYLKMTEIQYHPLASDTSDDKFYEFIELKNTSPQTLDLTGVRFTKGIAYLFPVGTLMNPGSFIVLASNRQHFIDRYGFEPFDEYEGQLDNGGERIVLIDSADDTLFSIRYNDKAPWPEAADGEGYSLVSKNRNVNSDPNDPTNWRASFAINGSPDSDDQASNVKDDSQNDAPHFFQLNQNYPNPFNPATKISYALPKSCFVTLKIYDLLGREISTLVNTVQQTGQYTVFFDAKVLPSGVYFYRLKAGDEWGATQKMLLIK